MSFYNLDFYSVEKHLFFWQPFLAKKETQKERYFEKEVSFKKENTYIKLILIISAFPLGG